MKMYNSVLFDILKKKKHRIPGKHRAHLVKADGDVRAIREDFLEEVIGIVHITLQAINA